MEIGRILLGAHSAGTGEEGISLSCMFRLGGFHPSKVLQVGFREGGTMNRLILVTSLFIPVVAIGIGAALLRATGTQATVAHPLVTKAEYERWQKELSNWGRLNLITHSLRLGIVVAFSSSSSSVSGRERFADAHDGKTNDKRGTKTFAVTLDANHTAMRFDQITNYCQA